MPYELYVGNIPKEFTEEEVKDVFCDFQGIKINKFCKKGDKCFSFVHCKDFDQTVSVIQTKHQSLVSGRRLIVRASDIKLQEYINLVIKDKAKICKEESPSYAPLEPINKSNQLGKDGGVASEPCSDFTASSLQYIQRRSRKFSEKPIDCESDLYLNGRQFDENSHSSALQSQNDKVIEQFETLESSQFNHQSQTEYVEENLQTSSHKSHSDESKIDINSPNLRESCEAESECFEEKSSYSPKPPYNDYQKHKCYPSSESSQQSYTDKRNTSNFEPIKQSPNSYVSESEYMENQSHCSPKPSYYHQKHKKHSYTSESSQQSYTNECNTSNFKPVNQSPNSYVSESGYTENQSHCSHKPSFYHQKNKNHSHSSESPQQSYANAYNTSDYRSMNQLPNSYMAEHECYAEKQSHISSKPYNSYHQRHEKYHHSSTNAHQGYTERYNTYDCESVNHSVHDYTAESEYFKQQSSKPHYNYQQKHDKYAQQRYVNEYDAKNKSPYKNHPGNFFQNCDVDALSWVSVSNFPIGTSNKSLYELFSDYNPIQVEMICNQPRRDKLMTEALVCFEDEDVASDVILNFDNTMYKQRVILVTDVHDLKILDELMDIFHV